jgi:hypothetical protein
MSVRSIGSKKTPQSTVDYFELTVYQLTVYTLLCYKCQIRPKGTRGLEMPMNGNIKRRSLASLNRKLARELWGDWLDPQQLRSLREITESFCFSIAMGDIRLLHRGWYVTHTGLIRLARRRRCGGITVEAITQFCDASSARWAFKATVYRSEKCRGFVGFGDADSSNVSPLVRGAEMRVAETRAVNRALRKAYGIGICSVEEIGSFADPPQPSRESRKLPAQPANGNYSGPRVRDRLCQIIRQYQLDPNLVKAYATDFCGTKTLREATREQVENFVARLADWAEKDRNALLCQLNSYMPTKEGSA